MRRTVPMDLHVIPPASARVALDVNIEDLEIESQFEASLPEVDVPPVAREFSAVRDLEYVADWPSALALLSRPPLRAVLNPLRLLVAGEVVEVPSYTAWWLSTQPVLAGRRPTLTDRT